MLNFDCLMCDCLYGMLVIFGFDVGLLKGQMGNFEVGYINIGVGCVVVMDLGQIDLVIEDYSFFDNIMFGDFICKMWVSKGMVYLMGVIFDGGVYGYIQYVIVVVCVVVEQGVLVVIYVIIDGCDVLLKLVQGFMIELMGNLFVGVCIGMVIGCYFVMDRDNCWDWVSCVFVVMMWVEGLVVVVVDQVVVDVYVCGEIDEFIQFMVIGDYVGVVDGDGFFCLNFCVDCVWEIFVVLGQFGFDVFDIGLCLYWVVLLGMVDYLVWYDEYMILVYFKWQVQNMLGVWVVVKGLCQFWLVEIEKYFYVIFFLNGGKEIFELGEDCFML